MPDFRSILSSVATTVTTTLADQFARVRGFFGEKVEEHLEDSDVQDALDALDNRAKGQLDQQMEALQDGKVDHASFYTNTTRILRRLYMGAAIIGAGGLGNVTEAVIERIQEFTSLSFERLQDFVEQLRERNTVTQADTTRLESYVDASYAAAESARRVTIATSQQSRQLTEERRILKPGDNCKTCVEEADKGWVPINTLNPIGQSECGRRCRCEFQYRIIDMPIGNSDDLDEYQAQGANAGDDSA